MDRGSDSAKTKGAVAIYGIRWPVRAAAYTAAVLCLVFACADLAFRFSWPSLAGHHTVCDTALGAVWFGTGAVTSHATAVSKRFLWHSSSVKWEDIREIRLHKRDGGALETRGDGKRVIVDSRFVARAHLGREIEQRTKLQPLKD